MMPGFSWPGGPKRTSFMAKILRWGEKAQSCVARAP
jgi:hypothetical protein